jgi:putative aldouronate transport system substrate-binding protein
MAFCKEVSSPKRHQWAFGTSPTNFILPYLLEMMGAPNGWSVDGGKFTSVNESPQMKEALAQLAKMWKLGYVHPDSIASPDKNYTWWQGETTIFYIQSFAGWSSYQTTYPSWQLGVVPPPRWHGKGLARKALGLPGYPDFPVFKKTGKARVEELLEICNYLAAPFGTQEYLTVNYGVRGRDYTEKNGVLKPTDYAAAEQMPIGYIGSQRYVSLYMPNDPESVKAQHKFLSDVLPDGVSNPAQGLYSETNLTKGASAGNDLTDLKEAIIQGRKPVSAWDDGVKKWRQVAGDKIRSEFEAAYAKTH